MQTGLYTHLECLEHIPPAYHAEKPERLKVILEALHEREFSRLLWKEAPKASQELLGLVHSKKYIDFIFNFSKSNDYETKSLNVDTYMSEGSLRAALRAVGGVCAATDKVMDGGIKNAFCAVRPPGHHATKEGAIGFCIFNSIAIAARHLQVNHGLSRVAIIDFSVHHGNGIQEMAQDYEGMFYASSQQENSFPETGGVEDNKLGKILNIPLPERSRGWKIRKVFDEDILPAVKKFNPEFILISAGFDGHSLDPLADLHLNNDDYVWLTDAIMDVADETCGGRIVSALEGGYNTDILAESVLCHVSALMR